MFMWAFGLALGMICSGCIAIVPVDEEPSPTPPRLNPSSYVRQEPAPLTKAEPGPQQRKALYVHTVKWSGETVSIIAAWYTGDPKNWKALAKANPQINPIQICEGDKILIPDHLLKTRESLPREFVKSFYSKSQKEKSWPNPPDTQVPEEEPKLFGPKKNPAR
jgi:hypothetical protein